MDIEKLIEQLKWWAKECDRTNKGCQARRILQDAATALSTLQAENKAMQKQLNEFSEFLCRMTGGLLSKTNYTAQVMATIAEDYQQKACRECNLQTENEKLRAELEQVVQKYETAVKLQVKMTEISNRQMAELEQVKRALAMMWFSYVNSDKEMPHSYETEALDEAERILGPWDECMPKYLRRGQKED